MRDWKQIVRDRIAVLRLEGAAELDLAEELAQHLGNQTGVALRLLHFLEELPRASAVQRGLREGAQGHRACR